MRAGNPGVPTASEWLNDVLAPGGRVGIDPVSFHRPFIIACLETYSRVTY